MKLVPSGERIRLGLLSLLLLLMLGIVCFAASGTYEAVRNFQQQNRALEVGDVSTIQSWMTLHVIARLYHVPEDYLSQTLEIGSPDQIRHFTLNQLASTKRQPVKKLIQTLQHAILNYRRTHHAAVKPPPVKQKLSQRRTNKKSRPLEPVSKIILHTSAKSHVVTAGRT